MRTPASTGPGRAFACLAILLCLLSARTAIASGPATGDDASADGVWPAARRHVRILDGMAYKFTSRLARVVELNDLLSGEVIVANNIGNIDSPSMGASKQGPGVRRAHDPGRPERAEGVRPGAPSPCFPDGRSAPGHLPAAG